MLEISFDAFMQQRHQVAAAYVNGDAGPLSDMSTRADPATFFAPGGGVEQGAAHVLEDNKKGAQQQYQEKDKSFPEVF